MDIDRIRADNAKRTGAERKQGLVINSGPNPTSEMRKRWQAEAKAKYGLSEAERDGHAERLRALAAARPGPAGGAGSAGPAGAQQLTAADWDILDVDLAKLTRAELLGLHGQLEAYNALVQAALAGAEGGGVGEGGAGAAAGPGDGAAAEAAPAPAAEPAPSGEGPARKKQKQPKEKPKKRDAAAKENAHANANGGGGAGALKAQLVDQVVEMGFSKRMARDALEEAGWDVEAAVNWLFAACS